MWSNRHPEEHYFLSLELNCVLGDCKKKIGRLFHRWQSSRQAVEQKGERLKGLSENGWSFWKRYILNQRKNYKHWCLFQMIYFHVFWLQSVLFINRMGMKWVMGAQASAMSSACINKIHYSECHALLGLLGWCRCWTRFIFTNYMVYI